MHPIDKTLKILLIILILVILAILITSFGYIAEVVYNWKHISSTYNYTAIFYY